MPGILVGYARTSTCNQQAGLDAQLRDLKAIGCEEMLERRREGVAKARADGKYKGRRPTARANAAEIIKFDAEGLQRSEIARRTGIGVASVYWVLADAKKLDAGRTIPV
jgi:DNA invertase Pin-like site-specific DNA recombinase